MRFFLSIQADNEAPSVLMIDEETKDVYLNGKRCTLTEQEYSLLHELSLYANQPVTREQLLREAWGFISPGETRTVDVHVQRLRKKIGAIFIETVYRFGYRLCAVAS